jgi:excisionase family DNA binding protein
MPEIEPLIYSVREVASLLGRTPRTIHRLISQGLLPARRLGRRYVVLPDELHAHLKSLQKAGEEQR